MRLKRSQPAPAAPVIMSGRQARKLARMGMAVYPPGVPPVPSKVNPAVPGSHTLRQTGGFRFRRHLVPFAWLAVLAVEGFALPLGLALLAAAVTAVLMVLLSRHLSSFAKLTCAGAALLTVAVVPTEAAEGISHPWPVVYVAAWLAVAIPWLHHYRWRFSPPPELPETNDHMKWEALAAEKKWNSHLGPPEQLPGGGRRYPIFLDGVKTTIGNVLSASENVAGAWHKPMTEAFAERSPDGITSRGCLTILGRDTLMRVREWDGAGIDPATGMAVIGRYADGSPARMKLFTPRYGTRHALISGTTGSGKTATMDLLIFAALTSGFIVPVVLDPQEGQSLPYWQDKVLYASGVPECVTMLRGLHAGMLDRSRYLAGLDWDDDEVPMHGMPFFDHGLTGLPVVLAIFTEAHMVLTGKSRECREVLQLTVEIGRLGRKTGAAMWLETHLPSLSDLGGEQALRDMLRGGNVLALRAANSVAAGMLGLQKDPGEIPPYFADGKETYGLGLLAGPDGRPDAPMRTDLVPKAMRLHPPAVPSLDDRFAAAMAGAMRKSVTAGPALRVVESPPDDEEAPEGRKAIDAVWAVLPADGSERERGHIIADVTELVTEKWGRKKFAIRTIANALETLTAGLPDGRRTTNERHGFYSRANPGNGSARAEG